MTTYKRVMTEQEYKEWVTSLLDPIPENQKGWRNKAIVYFRERGSIGSPTHQTHKGNMKFYATAILKFYEIV